MKMRDVTGYPLSSNQREEVEEFMSRHNITKNEARYALGFVPTDLPQVSIEEAFNIVKKENPNLELSYKTMDTWVDEVMKHAIPKPNPKFVRRWIDTVGMLCFEPSIFPPPVKLPFEIKYKYRKEN